MSTPAEQLGFQIGDLFRYDTHGEVNDPQFSDGSVIRFCRDDGSSMPEFELVTGSCVWNDNKAYLFLREDEYLSKIDEATEALTTVEQKRDRLILVVGAIAKLKEEQAQLIQEIKDAGFAVIGLEEIVTGLPADVSLTDPETWPAGSIVKCLTDEGGYPAAIKVGQEYQIGIAADGDRYITDDDGDDMFGCVARRCFEFVRHP